MFIADFHNDILTSGKFETLPNFYTENKIVTAIFKGNRDLFTALSLIKNANYVAFEDVGYTDFNYDKIISFNPVYVGLCWNGENQFGYGCDYSFGLKSRGVDLVRRLSKDKIAVDTAHISKRGFIDIIDNADIVVNSHTCLNGVFKHKRNLDDWQVKLIVEKGGLVGITCCAYFMSNVKPCKIDDYISNILYFYEKYGSDNLCIGTDFFGTDFLPQGIVEDYSGFDVIAKFLIERGMKKQDVDKVFYENLSKFLSYR